MSHPINPTALVVQKPRKLNGIISDSFRFLTGESKLFISKLALFALPLLGIGFIISYSITFGAPSIEHLIYYSDSIREGQFILLILSFLLYIAGFCMLTYFVSRIIIRNTVSNERQSVNGSEITTQTMLSDLKTYAVNFIIVYALFSICNYAINFLNSTEIFSSSFDADTDILNFIAGIFFRPHQNSSSFLLLCS